MTGSYIATTTEDDVQWLMAAGQSLGLAVAQLRHHLAQTLSPAHGALLAEPVEDAAGRATDWYGAGEGAAMALDQLPPGSRATMTNTVWALLRDIRAEGVRLGAAADADERVLGAMLEKVSHVPDVSCIRVRGDAPLLIAWAHGRAGQSVDLAQLLQPVDAPVTRSKPAPQPILDRPTQAFRPSWKVPLLIFAAVALAVALFIWSQRQPAETTTTASLPAMPPAPVVLAAPPQNTPTSTTLPLARPDPTTQTPTRPDPAAQAPAHADPAAQTPTPTAPPTAAPARPDTTVQATPPSPPPTVPSPGSGSAPATSSGTSASTTASTQSTSVSTPPETPPAVPPARPVASEDASSGSSERRQQADPTAASVPNPVPNPGPDPAPDAAASRTAHTESPAAPSPKPPQAAQLPPHESEAAPSARPFTVASVHDHDLALLQGCWNLRGSFATADVQTGAASKVSRWRTCFAAAETGAATLSGTQTLAWADGKSCSGPVTARFLPDDKLEIADASDCLGDRMLFRMTEQCTRKDDAAMLCAWTAHDRAANIDFRGEGLALTPAR